MFMYICNIMNEIINNWMRNIVIGTHKGVHNLFDVVLIVFLILLHHNKSRCKEYNNTATGKLEDPIGQFIFIFLIKFFFMNAYLDKMILDTLFLLLVVQIAYLFM